MKTKTLENILSVLLRDLNLNIKLHSINIFLKFPYISGMIRIQILLRAFVVITGNQP